MTPACSCVIPVRNERRAIAAAVLSCLGQRYEGALEVVVADAMSSDGTRQVVEELAAADRGVRLVDNPGRVTPAGLNAAIAGSSGEVVVRCDAHAVLPPGYVAAAVATLEGTGAVNVGGVQHAVGDHFTSRAIALAMTSPIGVGDARFHYGGDAGPVDTVYLGVFRRAALDQVGGFDEGLVRNQDYELNYRLRQAGGTVWFDPDLKVDYRPRASLGSLWRQYFDYGKGKRVMLRSIPVRSAGASSPLPRWWSGWPGRRLPGSPAPVDRRHGAGRLRARRRRRCLRRPRPRRRRGSAADAGGGRHHAPRLGLRVPARASGASSTEPTTTAAQTSE